MKFRVTIVIIFINCFCLLHIFSTGNNIVGDPGDARFNMYILEHTYEYFTQGKDLNPDFFYPTQNILYYSDNHFFNTIIYTPLRLIGLDKYTAFQWWTAIVFLLNFLAFYYAARRLCLQKVSAIAGAIVFTYALPVIVQVGHFQLLPRYFVPISFAFLVLFRQEGKARYLGWCIAALAIQLIINIYTGLFLTIILIIYALLNISKMFGNLVSIPKQVSSKPIEGVILLFSLLTGVLTLLNYIPYYYSAQEHGYRSWGEIVHFLPTLKSLLLIPTHSALWHNQWLSSGNIEMVVFPGVIPIIAVIICCYCFFKQTTLIPSWAWKVIVTLFISYLITLKFGDFSIYKYLTLLPGFSALRVISRIILIQLLLYGLIVGLVVDILVYKVRQMDGRYYYYSISALILFTIYADQRMTKINSMKKQQMVKMEQQWVEVLSDKLEECDAFVLSAHRPDAPEWMVQIDGMTISQQLGIPTLNGYSGRTPKNYPFVRTTVNRKQIVKWIKLNHQKGLLRDDFKLAVIRTTGRRPAYKFEVTYLTLNDILVEERTKIIYNYFLNRMPNTEEIQQARTLSNAKVILQITKTYPQVIKRRIQHPDVDIVLKRIYSLFVDEMPELATIEQHKLMLTTAEDPFVVIYDIIENYGDTYSNKYLLNLM